MLVDKPSTTRARELQTCKSRQTWKGRWQWNKCKEKKKKKKRWQMDTRWWCGVG